MSRFLSRFLRQIKIVTICWDRSRFIKRSQLYEVFLILKMSKSLDALRNLNKKYRKINLLLDRDWDKLSRNDKIYWSWQTSQSRSRLFGLNLDQDFLVSILIKISQLSRWTFLKMSGFFWLSNKLFCRCRDWDKLRPPGLLLSLYIWMYSNWRANIFDDALGGGWGVRVNCQKHHYIGVGLLQGVVC